MTDAAKGFQPTRPLRGATQQNLPWQPILYISTHAPLAGRDQNGLDLRYSMSHFNPRAPCGARQYLWHLSRTKQEFQPTRPLRGATGNCLRLLSKENNFNPRAPCGARRSGKLVTNCQTNFNPRAPCGARRLSGNRSLCRLNFNPRAPCGARRRQNQPIRLQRYFNPRAPCGARPRDIDRDLPAPSISTHAPLAGRDTIAEVNAVTQVTFQPTRPLRGATDLTSLSGSTASISTHAPLAGRDLKRK